MIWLILISAFCTIFYYKAVRPMSYWKDRGVVHKKPLPIIGNFKQIIFEKISFFDFIIDIYTEHSTERYFGSHQFLKPVLYVNDLDLIKRITVKDFEHFTDHNNYITEDVDPLLGKTLSNLKGERWRDMRATLSRSFTGNKMKMMFKLINECAEEFTKYFEEQSQGVIDVEMKDIFTRFTNDAIATAAFRFKCNSLEDKSNDFYMMGKKATNFSGIRFLAFIVFNCFPKLAKILNIKLIPNSVDKFFTVIIKDSIRQREKEALVLPDMIHLLMEAQKRGTDDVHDKNVSVNKMYKSHSQRKHKIELTDEDIVAQALIFFLGGFESSSTLMSFIAYELATNDDVQKKLQQEIEETLNKCDGKVTYEALYKLKYMDMVVSETLRKWPPGFMTDRMCVKDYVIEPVNSWEKRLVIEKGVIVQIPIVGIHHDPKYFPNPDKFDPERFSDDNKNDIPHFAYLPFGSGPRTCIARRFSLMETKTIIFHLLSKFDLVKTEKTPSPIRIAAKTINLGPAEGFWLGLKRRQTA